MYNTIRPSMLFSHILSTLLNIRNEKRWRWNEKLWSGFSYLRGPWSRISYLIGVHQTFDKCFQFIHKKTVHFGSFIH